MMMRRHRRLLLNIAGLTSAAAFSCAPIGSHFALVPSSHVLANSLRCSHPRGCSSASNEPPAPPVTHAVRQYTRDPLDTTEVDVAQVEALILERSTKRAQKDFGAADACRDRLKKELGVLVNDGCDAPCSLVFTPCAACERPTDGLPYYWPSCS